MEKRPFIIDCDPGIDDAVALFLAASREEFDIRAVTSVAGNVNIDLTTQNALDLCREAGLSTIGGRRRRCSTPRRTPPLPTGCGGWGR